MFAVSTYIYVLFDVSLGCNRILLEHKPHSHLVHNLSSDLLAEETLAAHLHTWDHYFRIFERELIANLVAYIF